MSVPLTLQGRSYAKKCLIKSIGTGTIMGGYFPLKNTSGLFVARPGALGERSLQLTQNAVWFTDRKFDDLIGARLRVAVGINAQLRRVARWPDMRDIAIMKINAHAVENIDAGDFVESKHVCEESR